MTDQFPVRNPAEAYQAFMVPTMFQPWSVELLDRVAPAPGERVLDVACGTGVVSRGAAERVGPGGEVIGLDISPAMLAVARSVSLLDGARLDWRQGCAEALPFHDGTFDVALCQQGVQFFADRRAGVREMQRVLRPGGRIGVSVWLGPGHQSVKGALLVALGRWFGEGAMLPYSFGEADSLRALFVDAGFHTIEIEVVRRQMTAPSEEEFIAMTVMGASAAVPALANATSDERAAAIRSLRDEIAPELAAVTDHGGLKYPMESHILTATKP